MVVRIKNLSYYNRKYLLDVYLYLRFKRHKNLIQYYFHDTI
ncbi:hypothetical protein HMPREF9171_0055 [Streptococcus agalactiae ATCC 13813]|nr:hypothetical protein HMPREF9171_0055 [Streptococcus agalactiae ATCC 13813]